MRSGNRLCRLARYSGIAGGYLGRSVEMVANPLEFMRPAFRKRMQRDEEVLYTAAERDLDLISVIIETMRGLLQPVSNVSPLMGRSS